MSQTKSAQTRPTPKRRSDLPDNTWSQIITFRHGQCDPAGIVYTPEFFNVFNQVIEEWFSDCLGIDYYEILGPRRTGLGYVNAQATFFTPCLMGEKIEVFVTVGKIGRKSYELNLHALKSGHEALCGVFTTVTTSLDTHQSIEIPLDIKDALLKYAKSNI